MKNFFKLSLRFNKKFSFEDLDLKIMDKKIENIDIKNINFSNHGFRKNTIEGEVFSKKFKINLNKNLNQIDFDLLNSGISARLNLLSKKSEMSKIGKLKGKILDSNF